MRTDEYAAGDLNLLDIILSAVVPVFFVMALGYLAGWVRDIDNHQVQNSTRW